MTTITLPIDPKYFWAIVWLAALALAVAAVYAAMPRNEAKRIDPLDRLKALLGAAQIGDGLFLLLLAMWAALFLALFGGLLLMLWEVIWQLVPATVAAEGTARFALVRLTAMTATLGAVAALPFTLIRLRLSREANNTAAESLFNDKINAATEDLHAMRQRWDGTQNIWEDDITRRNAAIDRLEGLANERPDTAPRISRQLSVYVRELTRDAPAKAPPNKVTPAELKEWAEKLSIQRSDMENAVQVLGRMKLIKGVNSDEVTIDLRSANLQGINVSGLQFSGANLSGAHLQGAELFRTKLKTANLTEARLEGADLNAAQMQGAHLFASKLQGANLTDTQLQRVDLNWARFDTATLLQGAKFTFSLLRQTDLTNVKFSSTQIMSCFGDASTTMPDGARPSTTNWPQHWPKHELDSQYVYSEWIKWRSNPSTYEPPTSQPSEANG